MKATIASLAFVGSALAAGGADGVNSVLTQVASDLKDFDVAIKGYSGGSDTSALMAASKKIAGTTASGAQSIASGADLSLTDAVGITSNVQSLQTTLDSTLSDLKSIGDKLASAGQCSTILEELAGQAKSAQALQDAITQKAPTETKAVAEQLGGAIGASIKDTNAYFTKTCANAPSGGASSSGSSSSGSSSSGSSMSGGAMSGGAMSGHSGMGGSSSGASSGSTGSSAGASGASGSSSSGSSGSKTNKASKTSTVPKPATYTGAASTLSIPFAGALALAFFAL